MRVLAIDSATQACSAALFENNEIISGTWEDIGRGHAERLIPMIESLPGKGRADRIVVSLGPGSFTGVRIGIAAARALGLAWQAEVLGYPTLALIAAMAQKSGMSSAIQPVSVAMTGGHGEWFLQDFAEDGLAETALVSLPPEQAALHVRHQAVAGDKADALNSLRPDFEGNASYHLLPDARQFMLTPQSFLTPSLSPIYGRAPDAKPASKPTQAAI